MNKISKYKQPLKEFATTLLGEGNALRIRASGYSMYPAIKQGDTIHIEPVKIPGEINQGDIIAWNRENDIVVHRLVHRYQSGESRFFITRGDSSMSSDRPVPFEMIAGKVTLIDTGKKKTSPVSEVSIPEWRYSLNSKRVWILVRIRRAANIATGRLQKQHK